MKGGPDQFTLMLIGLDRSVPDLESTGPGTGVFCQLEDLFSGSSGNGANRYGK